MTDPLGTESRPESQKPSETRKSEEFIKKIYKRNNFERIMKDEKCLVDPQLNLKGVLNNMNSFEPPKFIDDRNRADWNQGPQMRAKPPGMIELNILTPEGEILWVGSEEYEQYRGPADFIPLDIMDAYTRLTAVEYSRKDYGGFLGFNITYNHTKSLRKAEAGGKMGSALWNIIGARSATANVERAVWNFGRGKSQNTIDPLGPGPSPNISRKLLNESIAKDVRKIEKAGNILRRETKNIASKESFRKFIRKKFKKK